VGRHVFQACPVWIYTQSNITSIIFTWVHYTNTEKKIRARLVNEAKKCHWQQFVPVWYQIHTKLG
jgi:hypothetical protein